jgi:ATP synthase protein I
VLGRDGGKQLKQAVRLGSVGIELAVSTVLGWLFGHWLDGKFSTEPYLGIAFLLLGVAAGFRSLFLAARKQTKNSAAPPSDHE